MNVLGKVLWSSWYVLVCPWRFLKGLQQDTEPSSGWSLPQLLTATSL